MVRIATVNDAEQLNILNNEFNGEGASIDNIGNSLVSNKQEVVIVADEDDILVGFVCVIVAQLSRQKSKIFIMN